MTKLLEQAIEEIRRLPDDMQDRAARQLIYYAAEFTDEGERDDVTEARGDSARKTSRTLDQ